MTNLKLRYISLTILMLLLTLRAAAPSTKTVFIFSSPPVNAYERLIRAVVMVESSGDNLAYNLLEEATGAFQIRPIRIRDFNQRTGGNVKIEDCYSYNVSKEIFLYYALLSDYPDYELIARNWNGSGIATLEYWEKVKSKFE